jgi:hypothetical protein
MPTRNVFEMNISLQQDGAFYTVKPQPAYLDRT